MFNSLQFSSILRASDSYMCILTYPVDNGSGLARLPRLLLTLGLLTFRTYQTASGNPCPSWQSLHSRPCTDFSSAVCEPYDWLVHGSGKATFVCSWMQRHLNSSCLIHHLSPFHAFDHNCNEAKQILTQFSFEANFSSGFWVCARPHLKDTTAISAMKICCDQGTSQSDRCQVPCSLLGLS